MNYKVLVLIMIAIGVVIIIFAQQIVCPGLEMVFGIEAIVGKGNVVYDSDGSYVFTNPEAILKLTMIIRSIGACNIIAGVIIMKKKRQIK